MEVTKKESRIGGQGSDHDAAAVRNLSGLRGPKICNKGYPKDFLGGSYEKKRLGGGE